MQQSSVRFAPHPDTTIIETSQKKPCQAVKNSARFTSSDRSTSDITTNSAPPEDHPQHFAVAKTKRIGYFQSTPDFQERAERARKSAMGHAADISNAQFSEASKLWLEQKRIYNRESTILCYEDYWGLSP